MSEKTKTATAVEVTQTPSPMTTSPEIELHWRLRLARDVKEEGALKKELDDARIAYLKAAVYYNEVNKLFGEAWSRRVQAELQLKCLIPAVTPESDEKMWYAYGLKNGRLQVPKE